MNTDSRSFFIVGSIIILISFGACSKKEVTSGIAGECLEHIPAFLPVSFSSTDSNKLIETFHNSKELVELYNTAVIQDVLMNIDVLQPKKIAKQIAQLNNVPLSQVFQEKLLDGPLCGGLTWVTDKSQHLEQPAAGYIDYIIAKKLDKSQTFIQSSIELIQKATSHAEVTKVEDIEIIKLPYQELGLAYFVHNDYIIIGRSTLVYDTALMLSKQTHSSTKKLAPANLKQHSDAVLSLHVDIEQLLTNTTTTQSLMLLKPFKLVQATLNNNKTLDLSILPQQEWIQENQPIQTTNFLAKDSHFLFSSTQWNISKALEMIAMRAGGNSKPIDELGYKSEDINKHFSGDVTYAFMGMLPNSKSQEIFFDQFIAFSLHDGIKASTVENSMRNAFIKSLVGTYKRTLLKQFDDATLGCIQQTNKPLSRCFAISKNNLFIGYEPTLRKTLEVLHGKAPDITDNTAIHKKLGKFGFVYLDSTKIANDIKFLAKHHHGPVISQRDTENTLNPFLTALSKVKGLFVAIDSLPNSTKNQQHIKAHMGLI